MTMLFGRVSKDRGGRYAMLTETTDLWALVESRPEIDPHDLANAITVQVSRPTDDYRTRLLLHESIQALKTYWGPRFERWLRNVPSQDEIRKLDEATFDEVGFPSLGRRLMDKTSPDRVRQFFEYLGQRARVRERLDIAGSTALIVPGYLARRTEDVDIVGEIPKEIRENHQLLGELQQIFMLHLGFVQTHYFPMGWQERAHYLDRFGSLDVYLLDVYDVFLSKLFSRRIKDVQDMTVLVPQIDREVLRERLLKHCGSFFAAPPLKQAATDNWKVLFGEEIPQ